MRAIRPCLAAGTLALVAGACAPPEDDPVEPGHSIETTQGEAIIGNDDRIEHRNLPDYSTRTATSAIGAVWTAANMNCTGGNCALATNAWTQGWWDLQTTCPMAGCPAPQRCMSTFVGMRCHTPQRMCAGTRFLNQQGGASCSAFLVGPDLVATAGHCIRQQATDTPATAPLCANARMVFGFVIDAAGNAVTNIPAGDVYNCQQVVARNYAGDTLTHQDWAIFRLDRPVRNRPAFHIRRRGRAAVGTVLSGGSYPFGLPLKVETGTGAIQAFGALNERFEHSVDIVGGSSGSPAFSRGYVVEGITATGWTFQNGMDAMGNCVLVRTCGAGGCAAIAWNHSQAIERVVPLVPLVPQLSGTARSVLF